MTREFRAGHRYARITARKARHVIDLIRGRPVNQALDLLRHDRHRAARYIERVLASAVANALQDPDVKASRLLVSEAIVHGGPMQFGGSRFRPGPMGRAMPFSRWTSHIQVKVADPAAGD